MVDTAGKSLDNDTKWYNRYPQSVKDAGSISWGAPLGKPLTLKSASGVVNDASYIGPGVAALYWIPAIGISIDRNSPINRAAINLFVQLRSKQKAAHDYDSQDMMMGILAIDQLYTFYAYCRRIYGICRGHQVPMNYYYTRQLITAMGVDFDDMIQNLSNFRTWLNIFGISLGKYTLPKELDMTDRHMWMTDGLYLDADDLRAQTYMFVPLMFGVYNNTVTTGSEIDLQAIPHTAGQLITSKDLQSFGNSMLAAINGDDDIGFICGDLYAAYGQAAMRPLDPVPEDYVVVPSYSEEVLAQIENTKFVGQIVNGGKFTQDPSVNNGAILFNPNFSLSDAAVTNGFNWMRHMQLTTMINNHGKTAEPIDTVEKTRLTPRFSELTGSTGSETYALASCGTEICCFYQVSRLDADGVLQEGIRSTNSWAIPVDATWGGAAVYLYDHLSMEAFDWHWMLQVFNVGSASTSLQNTSWDVDNITTISDDDLDWLHEVALVSEFDMPSVSA